MKVRSILAVVLLGGCVTAQEDDRICLDWGYYPIVEERCIPLYGNVVCVTEERTRYWCKLYEENNE